MQYSAQEFWGILFTSWEQFRILFQKSCTLLYQLRILIRMQEFFKILRNSEQMKQLLPGVSKKVRLLTGNRNETIRYHYSPSGQLNLSIFKLDPHTLHLKIGHQTLEIQACKVKIYSAPETRGFVKGPSHDLLSQACCTGSSTLNFSFLH